MTRSGLALIALLAFAAQCSSFAQEPPLPLSLEQAIEWALTQNREAIQLERDILIHQYRVDEAETEFSTRLSPNGRAELRDGDDRLSYGLKLSRKFLFGSEVALSTTYDQQSALGIPSDDQYTGRIRVEVRQPLFRHAGTLVNNEPIVQARQQVDRSRRALEVMRSGLVLEVARQYETLLQLQRRIEADSLAETRLQHLHKLTALREKQGRTSRVDSLRVELQLGQLSSELQSRQLERDAAERALADLLGFHPDQRLALNPSPMLDVILPPEQEAVSVALSNRLDYAQMLEDYQDAERGEKIARRNVWPDLNLSFGYERFSTSLDREAALDMEEGTWLLGLETGSDLFRRSERAKLAQREELTRNNLLGIDILRYQIHRQVKAELSSYEQTRHDLTLATRNRELAEKRLTLTRKLYQLGRESNFSVTDAEEAHRLAVNHHLVARSEASISGYRLMNALGTLVEVPDELKSERHHGG